VKFRRLAGVNAGHFLQDILAGIILWQAAGLIHQPIPIDIRTGHETKIENRIIAEFL
jgi:hypothetical protein